MTKSDKETYDDGKETMEEGQTTDNRHSKKKLDVLYSVSERPPLVLLLILALQQFLTMFGATFSFPLLMSNYLCLTGDNVGLSKVISTVIFVAGLSTVIQSTIGIRLPIIQSVSYGFVQPFIVLLTLPKWKCGEGCVLPKDVPENVTAVNNITVCGDESHQEMWQARLRELQGAILVSSVFQVVVGFSGLVGLLMKYIGPLTIAPTISMIGLSLFDTAALKAQGQWWIALTTLALIAIFSQYMRNISIPICGYQQGQGCIKVSLRFFAVFPVLLAIALAWLLCYILTVTDALPSEPDQWGYLARTDVQGDAIDRAPWFRFPYPGQWGVPTVSAAGVLGCLAAVIASIVESVGDYHACARLSGAPPPPGSAVSRGIGIEGITCLFAGAWGSGAGTTSYSENIGAIGITKVGSRAVIQVSGLLMIVIGCVGKFSAIFVTIPEPVVGGLFLGMFSMVTAVGISNLQHVDLNSTRNLFVLGVSLVLGLSVPKWLTSPDNTHAIDTGNSEVDNIFTVLCSTSMFVAGVVGFFLDNTIPGTDEERGIIKWRQKDESDSGVEDLDVYNIPFIQSWLNRLPATKYIPFCPGFRGDIRGQKQSSRVNGHTSPDGQSNEAFETNNTQL